MKDNSQNTVKAVFQELVCGKGLAYEVPAQKMIRKKPRRVAKLFYKQMREFEIPDDEKL